MAAAALYGEGEGHAKDGLSIAEVLGLVRIWLSGFDLLLFLLLLVAAGAGWGLVLVSGLFAFLLFEGKFKSFDSLC